MSRSSRRDPSPDSRSVRVSQAAAMLGISERTVYRWLKSGRLAELPIEEISPDNVTTTTSNNSYKDTDLSASMVLVEQILRRIDTTSVEISTFCHDAARREEKIAVLLETQQELTRTIQNMQGQLTEISRAMAGQNVSRAVTEGNQAGGSLQAEAPRRAGWLFRILTALRRG